MGERTYNTFGDMTQESITTPGYGVSYSYDNALDKALGRVSKVYDGPATLVGNEWLLTGNVIETYSYLGAGMLTDVKRPMAGSGAADDVHLKLTYDPFGRVEESLWKRGTGTVLDQVKYLYDKNGRTTGRDNLLAPGSAPQMDYRVFHDAMGRVTEVKQGTVTVNWALSATGLQSVEWQYDVRGNRTGATANTDATNQPATYAPGSTTQTVTYDLWDRLVKTEYGDTTTEYQYDAIGRVATEKEFVDHWTDNWESHKVFVHDVAGRVLLEDLVDTGGDSKYVWSPVTGSLIRRDRDANASGSVHEEKAYVLYDGQGNITAITNDTGVVAERYSTDPFGGNVRVFDASWKSQSAVPSDATEDMEIGHEYLGTAYDWTYFGGSQRINQITGLYVTSGGAYNADIDRMLSPLGPAAPSYEELLWADAPWYERHADLIGGGIVALSWLGGPAIGVPITAYWGMVNRSLDGQGFFSSVGGGLADGTGLSSVYGAFSNEDIMTHAPLGWSTGERWLYGTLGALQYGSMFGGSLREVGKAISGMRDIPVPALAFAVTPQGAIITQATISLSRLGGVVTATGNVLTVAGSTAGALNQIAYMARSSTSGNNRKASQGRTEHSQYSKRMNQLMYRVDKAISKSNRLRPDAWKVIRDDAGNPIGVFLRELKPNNTAAKARGWSQLEKYEAAIKRAFLLC